MRSSRQHRFTVYDVMEAQGVFDENPANSTSPDYRGPLEYPKILYHPEGKTRVTQRAEIISTPLGAERVGEIRQLINRIAHDAAEEAELRAKGWHLHPSSAIVAGGGEAPPVVSATREMDLEAQIAILQNQLDMARRAPKPVTIDPDEMEIEAPRSSRRGNDTAAESRAK